MGKYSNAVAALAGTGLILICMIVRISVSQEPLWLDELHSAWCVCDGFDLVAGRAADGNQGPLFFWATWPLVALFGQNELALRAVSLASGAGILSLAVLFVWKQTRSIAAILLTGGLICLDWRFVFYGTEARPYALMQLLGLAQAYLFVDLAGWLKPSTPDRSNANVKWIGLTLLSIALFYCHYTCVWLFAAEVIMLPCVSLKKLAKTILLAASTVAVGCLPGLLNLSVVLGRRTNWSSVSSISTLWADVRTPILVWLLLPIGIWLLNWAILKFQKKTTHSQPKQSDALIGFILIWGLVPIVGAMLTDLSGIAPLALFRYTTIGTVALAIFAGLVVQRLSLKPLRIVTVLLVLIFSNSSNPIALQLARQGSVPFLRNENWGTSIATINQKTDKRHHPVFVFANVLEDAAALTDDRERFQNYLLFPVSGFDAIDRTERLVTACPTSPEPHFLKSHFVLTEQHGGAWLLVRGSNPIQSIVKELQQGLSEIGSDKTVDCKTVGPDNNDVYLLSIDLR